MYITKIIAITLSVFLSSCTNIIRTSEESETVRLFFLTQVVDKSLNTDFNRGCTYIGEVVGSEGHWYTYLFISNTNLTQGAINDLKNKARDVSANTVIVHKNIDFATSVTLLGQAYSCKHTSGNT